jgi:hypothetical protein
MKFLEKTLTDSTIPSKTADPLYAPQVHTCSVTRNKFLKRLIAMYLSNILRNVLSFHPFVSTKNVRANLWYVANVTNPVIGLGRFHSQLDR